MSRAGYMVSPSPMSIAGETYVAASGDEIANECQVVLPTVSGEGVVTKQVWQVANVTKNFNRRRV